MKGVKNKILSISLTLLSIVGYGIVAFSYGQLTDLTPPDAVRGYNVHEFIKDPGCAPGDTGCFKNTSYWELANNNADIYFDYAQVGIGLTDPLYALDIVGDTKVHYTGSNNDVVQVIGDLSADADLSGFGLDNGVASFVVDDFSNPGIFGFSRLDYNSGDPVYQATTRYSDGGATNFSLKRDTGEPKVELESNPIGSGKSNFSLSATTSGEPTATLLNTFKNGGTGNFNILAVNSEPRLALSSVFSGGQSTSFSLGSLGNSEPESKLISTFSNSSFAQMEISEDSSEPTLNLETMYDPGGGSQSSGEINITKVNGESQIDLDTFLSNGAYSQFTLGADTTGEPESYLHANFSNGNYAEMGIFDNNSEPKPTIFTTDTVTGSGTSFELGGDGGAGDGYDQFSLFSEAPGTLGGGSSSANFFSRTVNGEKAMSIGVTNSLGRQAAISVNSSNATGYPEIVLQVSSSSGIDGAISVGDDGSGEPMPMLGANNTNTHLNYGISAFSDNATYYRCNENYTLAPGIACYDDRLVSIQDDKILTNYWTSASTQYNDRLETGQLVDDAGVQLFFERQGIGSSATGSDTSLTLDDTLTFDTGTDVFAVANNGTIYSDTLTGGATSLSVDASGHIIRTPSDRRLKKEIENIDYGLDTLMELRPVSYYMKDGDRFGDARNIGFIAQEVDEIIPEVVSKGGDYYSLNYGNLTAVIVKAIQDLKVEVDGIQPMTIDDSTVFDGLQAWFADRANQLASIFVKKAHVEELCVGTENDETCLTKDQIDQLLLLQNNDSHDSSDEPTDNNEDSNDDTQGDDHVVVDPLPPDDGSGDASDDVVTPPDEPEETVDDVPEVPDETPDEPVIVEPEPDTPPSDPDTVTP